MFPLAPWWCQLLLREERYPFEDLASLAGRPVQGVHGHVRAYRRFLAAPNIVHKSSCAMLGISFASVAEKWRGENAKTINNDEPIKHMQA